jgi:phosphate transport system permease protein
MTKDRFKNTALIQASLKKRYARERRFQMYGKLAVLAGFVFLFVLLFDIVSKGTPAFTQQHISIAVNIDVDALGVSSTASQDEISKADFSSLIKSSLREMFPDVKSRGDKRQLYRLVSIGAEYDLRDKVLADPTLLGKKQDIWMLAHSQAASYLK